MGPIAVHAIDATGHVVGGVHQIRHARHQVDVRELGEFSTTNLEVVSGSQMENNMKLIRIRKNKIYFDFYYLDPISGTKKRCQSSTGLKNILENQVIAQQKALGHYHALSQLGKPKVEPPMVQKVFHSQPTQKTPDSFSSSYSQEKSFIEIRSGIWKQLRV